MRLAPKGSRKSRKQEIRVFFLGLFLVQIPEACGGNGEFLSPPLYRKGVWGVS